MGVQQSCLPKAPDDILSASASTMNEKDDVVMTKAIDKPTPIQNLFRDDVQFTRNHLRLSLPPFLASLSKLIPASPPPPPLSSSTSTIPTINCQIEHVITLPSTTPYRIRLSPIPYTQDSWTSQSFISPSQCDSISYHALKIGDAEGYGHYKYALSTLHIRDHSILEELCIEVEKSAIFMTEILMKKKYRLTKRDESHLVIYDFDRPCENVKEKDSSSSSPSSSSSSSGTGDHGGQGQGWLSSLFKKKPPNNTFIGVGYHTDSSDMTFIISLSKKDDDLDLYPPSPPKPKSTSQSEFKTWADTSSDEDDDDDEDEGENTVNPSSSSSSQNNNYNHNYNSAGNSDDSRSNNTFSGGGATVLEHLCNNPVHLNQGSMLIFPGGSMRHKGTSINKGVRVLLVGFLEEDTDEVDKEARPKDE